MATSFGLGNEPDIIVEDIPSYTQEDVKKAVKGAGYLDLDVPPEFSQQGAIAQLEADLMNDIMIRDQLREEELLGQQNMEKYPRMEQEFLGIADSWKYPIMEQEFLGIADSGAIDKPTYTQEDVQKAVRNAGYLDALPPVSKKKVVLYGDDAVKQVEKLEGRPLTYDEQFVVREEGFVNKPYQDTKGIITYGVGQTGNWINKSFSEAYEAHKEEARKLIPSFDNLSKELQAALMSAVYRGDLQQSPDFRKLFNAGKYKEASKEFLDNDDYRASVKSGDGVHKRMERVANIVKNAV